MMFDPINREYELYALFVANALTGLCNSLYMRSDYDHALIAGEAHRIALRCVSVMPTPAQLREIMYRDKKENNK